MLCFLFSAEEEQAKFRKKLGIDEDSDEILKHSKKWFYTSMLANICKLSEVAVICVSNSSSHQFVSSQPWVHAIVQ